MNEADTHPPRPSNEEVAAALIRVAEGEPFVADVQAPEPDGVQQLDTLCGWRLAVWWRNGQLGPLHCATDPAGLLWVYGCARWPDWTAGPDAVVLDPIRHLLDEGQRQALAQRLRGAVCWPPVEPYPINPPPLDAIWTDAELLEMGGG